MPKRLINLETEEEERAFLVIAAFRRPGFPSASAAELESLALSAGCVLAGRKAINVHEISPSLFIGRGQAEDVSFRAQKAGADVVVFNVDLSPAQQANLEEILKIKTIDRTQLILDIFARRAKSSEGKLQVELAQLEYLLPRLKGKGVMLSRLGGGIGTRGPGEQKLEIDRRRISERIRRLKKDIAQIGRRRGLLRQRRQKSRIKVVSLIGYTNAGKTTLFNLLSSSSQKTAAAFFTTLDPLSRQVKIAGEEIVITDTVGFIESLPSKLRQAFRATLEELHFAHLLLHIIDASRNSFERDIEAVKKIISLLGLEEKPCLMVFNKIDRLSPGRRCSLETRYPEAVFISALRRQGIEALAERIKQELFGSSVRLKVLVKDASAWERLAKYAEILKVDSCPSGRLAVEVEMEKERWSWLAEAGGISLIKNEKNC